MAFATSEEVQGFPPLKSLITFATFKDSSKLSAGKGRELLALFLVGLFLEPTFFGLLPLDFFLALVLTCETYFGVVSIPLLANLRISVKVSTRFGSKFPGYRSVATLVI